MSKGCKAETMRLTIEKENLEQGNPHLFYFPLPRIQLDRKDIKNFLQWHIEAET